MPLREKFDATFPAQVAAYIDRAGACRRVVLSCEHRWGGLGADLQAALAETTFTPGRSFGGPVATGGFRLVRPDRAASTRDG